MSVAENVQERDPITPSVESVSVPSDSQLSMVAWLGIPPVKPVAVTPVMATVWVSVKSASVNVTVPCAVSCTEEFVVHGSSVIEPTCAEDVTTGVSLVPVIVMVIVLNAVSLLSA